MRNVGRASASLPHWPSLSGKGRRRERSMNVYGRIGGENLLPNVGFGRWRRERGLVRWEAALGDATLAFSARAGGESAPPYDALNLGLHVGDAPSAVLAN